MYKNLFIDLDDTLWAFSENARDTFSDMYDKYHYDRYFDSFDHFYSIYTKRNVELWDEYGDGKITKDELNEERFFHPLRKVGVDDKELSFKFSADFFSEIVFKKKLMPNVIEALEYLAPKYNLYILSNGFRELQQRKMQSGGIDQYFKKIILSEDIGVHKPYLQIFQFALSATQSDVKSSLMIGDNWENDIAGAKNAGFAQGFYNIEKKEKMAFQPTFVLNDWNEIELKL